MTIKELREALTDLPDDMLVVLAKDGEGNGHSPLAEADRAMYLADSTWSGDVYLTPEQLAQEPNPDEWDEVPENAVRVLLLGPVN